MGRTCSGSPTPAACASTNDLRYINHHPDPNAVYYDDLTVYALRDIAPGEEITHNYWGDDAAEHGAEALW